MRARGEELGEGGLLLHATTARQGGDELVEGDPGNGARSLEQEDDPGIFANRPLAVFLLFDSGPFPILFSVYYIKHAVK